MNVHALIGQSALVYCASKLMEISWIHELLYRRNRPQVLMVYKHDKALGMLEEHSKNL